MPINSNNTKKRKYDQISLADDSECDAKSYINLMCILYHSSRCCLKDDCKCPIYKHCGEFRKLWRHIPTCRDKDCKVRHCANARLALSHYYGCKNKDCYGCNSVKDYIKVRNQHGEIYSSIMIKNQFLQNRKFLKIIIPDDVKSGDRVEFTHENKEIRVTVPDNLLTDNEFFVAITKDNSKIIDLINAAKIIDEFEKLKSCRIE